MAFDGISVAALTYELNERLSGGRISKIIQPERDALLLHIKTREEAVKLLFSANPSLPLAYITDKNLSGPPQAPAFLMLLRKHLAGARILSISQPGLERVIRLEAEHLDEMGDLCRHSLILEIMGKHSNLILTDQEDLICDAIRRIGSGTSSVREVLPGRPYFIPNTQDKLAMGDGSFWQRLSAWPGPVEKALSGLLTGISPQMARELVLQAGLEGSEDASALTEPQKEGLEGALSRLREHLAAHAFSPRIYYHNGEAAEFSALPLSLYGEMDYLEYDSMSQLLFTYYAERNSQSRIKQRSAELRHLVTQSLERNSRKRDLMEKQLKDAEKREKYKLWGELIQSFGYGISPGARELTARNYYDNDAEITIPLDETLTPQENAARYFDRYQKLKRTLEATLLQIEETDRELEYLRSVEQALNMAEGEEDLAAIKEELTAGGYIRSRGGSGKKKGAGKTRPAQPLHYTSSEGFDFYVGKNNLQNEPVTFQLASGGDWWFHAKGIAGSHVIVKTGGRELSDKGFEEASALAAWYSSAPKEGKCEVDYTRRKELKKPGSAKPGMVICHTNYSMMVTPSLEGL
ncbi:MAG: NFACT family protein, partial [Lachnospiraceae bacterium]|nr:NFACT family protein [Lachnospiraceae bacterium]